MAAFTVNGKTVTTEKKRKRIRFLRDELRLTAKILREGRIPREEAGRA